MKELLLSGSKDRTNRPFTRFRNKCRIGDIMHIYTGLRSSKSKKLFDTRVIEKVRWNINSTPKKISIAKIKKSPIKNETWEKFALNDGFICYEDFLKYFTNHPKKTSTFICFKFPKYSENFTSLKSNKKITEFI